MPPYRSTGCCCRYTLDHPILWLFGRIQLFGDADIKWGYILAIFIFYLRRTLSGRTVRVHRRITEALMWIFLCVCADEFCGCHRSFNFIDAKGRMKSGLWCGGHQSYYVMPWRNTNYLTSTEWPPTWPVAKLRENEDCVIRRLFRAWKIQFHNLFFFPPLSADWVHRVPDVFVGR